MDFEIDWNPTNDYKYKDSKTPTDIVILDSFKAFDTVPPDKLYLSTLWNNIFIYAFC